MAVHSHRWDSGGAAQSARFLRSRAGCQGLSPRRALKETAVACEPFLRFPPLLLMSQFVVGVRILPAPSHALRVPVRFTWSEWFRHRVARNVDRRPPFFAAVLQKSPDEALTRMFFLDPGSAVQLNKNFFAA